MSEALRGGRSLTRDGARGRRRPDRDRSHRQPRDHARRDARRARRADRERPAPRQGGDLSARRGADPGGAAAGPGRRPARADDPLLPEPRPGPRPRHGVVVRVDGVGASARGSRLRVASWRGARSTGGTTGPGPAGSIPSPGWCRTGTSCSCRTTTRRSGRIAIRAGAGRRPAAGAQCRRRPRCAPHRARRARRRRLAAGARPRPGHRHGHPAPAALARPSWTRSRPRPIASGGSSDCRPSSRSGRRSPATERGWRSGRDHGLPKAPGGTSERHGRNQGRRWGRPRGRVDFVASRPPAGSPVGDCHPAASEPRDAPQPGGRRAPFPPRHRPPNQGRRSGRPTRGDRSRSATALRSSISNRDGGGGADARGGGSGRRRGSGPRPRMPEAGHRHRRLRRCRRVSEDRPSS